MEMALGRQRVLVFTVINRAERPVNAGDLQRVYVWRLLRRELEQERRVYRRIAWMSMTGWWDGKY